MVDKCLKCDKKSAWFMHGELYCEEHVPLTEFQKKFWRFMWYIGLIGRVILSKQI